MLFTTFTNLMTFSSKLYCPALRQEFGIVVSVKEQCLLLSVRRMYFEHSETGAWYLGEPPHTCPLNSLNLWLQPHVPRHQIFFTQQGVKVCVF